MRDRLQDLQVSKSDKESGQNSPSEEKKKPAKKDSAGPQSTIGDFFNELAEIKESIANIKTYIGEIQLLHDKTLNAVTSEKQNAEIARELDAAMDKANRESAMIRNKLKEMDKVNKQLKKSDPDGGDTNIRITQHGVITKNFLEVMTEYKRIQEMYQTKFKDRMHRQALIVNPNASEAEIEKMVEGETQMFSAQIVNTAQRVEAKRALEDIQKKHLEVVKIEKSILELQQLFMDMAVLLAAQGEMVDQIAVNVGKTVDHTEKGVQALNKAVKYQRKSRKKMCIIMTIIIVIIGIILTLVLVFGVKL